MKALILAAGTGSRLMPLTEDRPKCLVKLGEKSLLDYQMDALKENGVSDISIVTGYKEEAISKSGRGFEHIFHNDNFLNNNMVSSLLFGKELFDNDLMVSYADIVYTPEIVAKLKESDADFSVVVDEKWLDLWKNRCDNPLDDAESLKIEDETITDIGKKVSDLSEIEAQYIGLMKITQAGLQKILKLYEQAQTDIKEGRDAWGFVKNLDKAYFTDLITALIQSGEKIKPVRIQGNWFEVDTFDDYKLYEKDLKAGVDFYSLGRS